jgi:hypothetical protein
MCGQNVEFVNVKPCGTESSLLTLVSVTCEGNSLRTTRPGTRCRQQVRMPCTVPADRLSEPQCFSDSLGNNRVEDNDALVFDDAGILLLLPLS